MMNFKLNHLEFRHIDPLSSARPHTVMNEPVSDVDHPSQSLGFHPITGDAMSFHQALCQRGPAWRDACGLWGTWHAYCAPPSNFPMRALH